MFELTMNDNATMFLHQQTFMMNWYMRLATSLLS